MDAQQAQGLTPVHLLGLEPGDVVVLGRHAAREVDRLATAEFGIPSIVLMENAAIHLAWVVRRVVEARGADEVVVVAGPGNNGGDGFTAARHLANAGVSVRVVAPLGLPRSGDASVNLDIAQRMGVRVDVPGADLAAVFASAQAGTTPVIVDALFGTGLDRAVVDRAAEVIERINEARAKAVGVIAADIPSGVDCETGEVLGVGVVADVTVMFAGLKRGLLTAGAHAGELWLAGIGVPTSLLHRLGSAAVGVGAWGGFGREGIGGNAPS